jgi:PKD repeat protein
MFSICSARHGWRPAALLLLAAAAVGCGLEKQSAPDLIGPSEFSLSITMTATPDQLPRDGSSQSVIVLTARDAQGRPVSGQRITLGTSLPVALSQTEVVTGNDGRATFSVRAPAPGTVGNELVIFATPIGSNSENAIPRSVTVLIGGPSNSTEPTPSFTVTPQVPEVNQAATFDASGTTDEGGPCGSACTYTWNFDDGGTATGRVVTHAFTTARAFNVMLTVRDVTGVEAVLRQLVTVIAPSAPIVTLAVAPNPPVVNQLATFTATATPAPNHSIRQYEWNFGDGTTATTSSNTVTKTFTTRGVFEVTVRATDDLGQVGAASLRVDLNTGVPTGITAVFTFSPTNPRAGDAVNFNAASSTPSGGATITEYRWDFGDGTPPVTMSTPTIQHPFAVGDRIYVVRLTVVDSQGRTAPTTQNVTVRP